MPQNRYDLKLLFEGDPAVLLTVEEYKKKVSTGMTLWQVYTYVGLPAGYHPYTVEDISTTIFKAKGIAGMVSIADCFYGIKCICLTEEKAIEVYNTFKERCISERRLPPMDALTI